MNEIVSNSTKQKSKSVDLASLKQKSVSGGIITIISQGISVAVQLLSTVILARILSPDDYGIMAMVAAITAVAGLFRDFGLSTAAVQKEHLSISEQSNLFWVNVALGGLLTTILIIVSPGVAWFYKSSELTLVIAVVSFSFLIGSLGTQSGILLVREMRFGLNAIASIGGVITSLVVSVVLALNEYCYWSLVWGQIAGSIATTCLLFIVSPFRPSLPRKSSELKKILGFGSNVAAFDIINYFARNLDDILIGRFCGAATLGLYSRAYGLLMLPISNIRNPIMTVAFPVMSRIKNHSAEYCSYYRRIVSLMSHASMPLIALLFVNSNTIIELILGQQWLGAAPIFSILAITAFIQSSYTIIGVVLLSLGKSQRYLKIGIANAFFTVVGFSIGICWGAIGVAVAYAIVTYITVLPFILWAFNGTPLQLRDFLDAVWLQILGSLSGIGIVLLINSFNSYQYGLFASLVTKSFIFSITYLTVLLIFPSGRNFFSWILSTCKETFISKNI